MLDELLTRFRAGDRRALARLITLAARGEVPGSALAALPSPPSPARVVALTGSGGVGKSSLTGRLIGFARQAGERVAVLACDPESPVSGGALLGDRFRMPGSPDEGVYIRSLAAAGGLGALAEHLADLVRLCECFGFGLVLIETVGAGQGDTAARAQADVLVLLLQPETGDDLQWEKAGLVEVADVIVIHKADLPGADRVKAQVLATLALGPGPTAIPVLEVSSRTGDGLAALWEVIRSQPLRRRQPDPAEQLWRATQELAGEQWRGLLRAGDPALEALLRRWEGGERDGALLREVLARVARG